MKPETYTVFKVSPYIQVRWYGGKTFNIYTNQPYCNSWWEIDAFTHNNVETIEDATDIVDSWWNDLVGTEEVMDYIMRMKL